MTSPLVSPESARQIGRWSDRHRLMFLRNASEEECDRFVADFKAAVTKDHAEALQMENRY